MAKVKTSMIDRTELLYMTIYFIEELELVGFRGHFDQVVDIKGYTPINLTWEQFYHLLLKGIPEDNGPWHISKEEFKKRIFDILL